MSFLFEDAGPAAVSAPPGALAWSPDYGFMFDADELVEHRAEGLLVLDAADGELRGVEAVATPLWVTIRQDEHIARLAAEINDLRSKVAVAAEDLTQALSEPADGGVS